MLTKPTPEALIAFDQISKLPRWGKVDEAIDSEVAAIFERILGTSNDAELHALRGRAAALKDFQKAVREASSVLAKLGHNVPL